MRRSTFINESAEVEAEVAKSDDCACWFIAEMLSRRRV
jgi:hypothetical protein